VEREANNGTRGQRHCFFADNPCSFNMIGGVTGTRRANESRTKEQGRDESCRAGRFTLQNRSGCRHRTPQNHPGCERRVA